LLARDGCFQFWIKIRAILQALCVRHALRFGSKNRRQVVFQSPVDDLSQPERKYSWRYRTRRHAVEPGLLGVYRKSNQKTQTPGHAESTDVHRSIPFHMTPTMNSTSSARRVLDIPSSRCVAIPRVRSAIAKAIFSG